MAAKKSARRSTRSASPSAKGSQGRYTRPALRERLKKKIQASDKGGKPGQWSARKSQLLAQEYKKEGGGYVGGKGESQKSLDSWTKESWQTREGTTRARHGRTTSRYLPKKAWDALSEGEKDATEKKKRSASRRGKQFVANTPAAKTARKKATSKRPAKAGTSRATRAPRSRKK